MYHQALAAPKAHHGWAAEGDGGASAKEGPARNPQIPCRPLRVTQTRCVALPDPVVPGLLGHLVLLRLLAVLGRVVGHGTGRQLGAGLDRRGRRLALVTCHLLRLNLPALAEILAISTQIVMIGLQVLP